MSNAQAALLAAAGQFSDAEVDINPDTVTGIAARYKGWLDRKDREDRSYSTGGLLPGPVVSRGGVDPEFAQDVKGTRNRHPDGDLSNTGACPQCGAASGLYCRTDTGLKLTHGHVL